MGVASKGPIGCEQHKQGYLNDARALSVGSRLDLGVGEGG